MTHSHNNLKNKIIHFFWFDNWTELGPFIVYLGESDLSQLRMHNEEKVCDAVGEGNWFLSEARSNWAESILIALASRPLPTPYARRTYISGNQYLVCTSKNFPPKKHGSNFGFLL